MFDFSDDEVDSGKFIQSRNPRPRRKSSTMMSIDGSLASRHVSAYASRNFMSDFRLKSTGQKLGTNRIFHEVYPGARLPVDDGQVVPHFVKPGYVDVRPFPPGVDDEDHPDSFYKSMKFPLRLAQVFSLLPMTGFADANYKSIRFRRVHWKLVYFACTTAGTVFILACSLASNFAHGLTYDKSAGVVFFGASLAASILLLFLARNWRTLNEDFAVMERRLVRYKYPRGVARQFKVVTCVFMIIALVEHVLSKVAQLSRTTPCARDGDLVTQVEVFFGSYYNEIFNYTAYSLWKGIALLMLHLLCTFTWNFTDLFLSLISWTIAKRFRLYNEALFKVVGQVFCNSLQSGGRFLPRQEEEKDPTFWSETRADYNELTGLTKKVDSHIQKLMLLSLGDNLYFICLQLLKGLKKSGNFQERIYFLWSVSFLIARTCFVAFTAASINDESKEVKAVLYSVPESGYSAETRRFLTQLTTNEVALTGCNFFSITRGLILTIAGTVVTYEVILVQFSTGEEDMHTAANQTQCLSF